MPLGLASRVGKRESENRSRRPLDASVAEGVETMEGIDRSNGVGAPGITSAAVDFFAWADGLPSKGATLELQTDAG